MTHFCTEVSRGATGVCTEVSRCVDPLAGRNASSCFLCARPACCCDPPRGFASDRCSLRGRFVQTDANLRKEKAPSDELPATGRGAPRLRNLATKCQLITSVIQPAIPTVLPTAPRLPIVPRLRPIVPRLLPIVPRLRRRRRATRPWPRPRILRRLHPRILRRPRLALV